MKTDELTGLALDWAVAMCEGVKIIVAQENWDWYSSSWEEGGPIIEREEMSVRFINGKWFAQMHDGSFKEGPTPLVAAMRCYVASKMGNEIELPKEFV